MNRHHCTALTLQAICDSQRKFLDVFTGISSKIHDARVFGLSFISNSIEQICENGRYHLLGDSAYPIRTFLLTPYKDYGNLNDSQISFNLRLSKTRVKIENAFGLLKQRFRQLMRTDFWQVLTTSHFIIAVCVLHNICITNEDYWEEIDIQEHHNPNNIAAGDDLRENELRRRGENKRNDMCNFLANRNI